MEPRTSRPQADRRSAPIKRPPAEQTDYYPNAWSFSFEEQLSEHDFNGEKNVDARAWIERAVLQEILGDRVTQDFDVDEARVLAVAIEESIFNPFVVVYLPLKCDSKGLGEALRGAPDRMDCTEYKFFDLASFADVVNVFVQRGVAKPGDLHPTSRYRIYLGRRAFWSTSVVNVEEQLLRAAAHRFDPTGCSVYYLNVYKGVA